MLRDGASSANLFSRGEHGVEDVVAFFDLVIIVVIVIQVRGEIWQVTIVSFQFVPIVSMSLFQVDRADGQDRALVQLLENSG
jgi:hypothetical protein